MKVHKNEDGRWKLEDGGRHRRRLLSPSIFYPLSSILVFLLLLLIAGCIGKPQYPAATQPATEVDLATTQPSYWLSQPAAAQVQASDFDALWESSKSVARSYLFAIDREDFRDGLITTEPMVSKQVWELWRPDTGTLAGAMENSLATIRRTLRFEIDRDEQTGAFTVTPKVLVERLAILERRVTSTLQYRAAVMGTAAPSRYSIARDDTAILDLPPRYWYPIGRDTRMEQQVAARLRDRLKQPRAKFARDPKGASTLAFDAAVSSPGPNDLIYIDLGARDGIVPGMTFEAYDARSPLPPLEHFAEFNPGSKGWIEVIRADQTSSACRVLGEDLSNKPAPGDRVFNFIYERDPQKPNHFVLAGDFTPSRQAIAALIRQWRGVVDDSINNQTTYVVLGQAPADETARQAYRAARQTAQSMNIPIIDEPRFNLLVRQPSPPR
jgi:hypothetical protein